MSKGGAGSGRVLVTDGHWNKTVAAVRSLGRYGLKVTVGESTRLAPALFSRHASRRLRYPSPQAQPEPFLAALLAELTRFNYDLLLPMELKTLLLLSKERQRFSHLVRFPFAPDEILRRAASKSGAVGAARECGVPHPRSVMVGPESDIENLLAEPGLPLVLKPDLGEGGRGLMYCRNREELEQALAEITAGGAAYLAQEWIPPGGIALGVSLLLDKAGRVAASFTHRRLREYPVSGGPSSLRAAWHHAQAEADAVRLLRGLNFSGPAMVEFKVDPRDNKAKLMEINPRFWGSLPLAIRAGVDFPVLTYRLAMGEHFSPPVPAPDTTLRNLLPGDLLYFVARRGRVGREFFDFKKHPDELLSVSDPGPALGRLLSPLALLYDQQLKAVLKKRQEPR